MHPALSTGGGKNDIPNRLKRQFAIFNMPLPSVASINGIFGKLVEGRFSADLFSDAVVQVWTCCWPVMPQRAAVPMAGTCVHRRVAGQGMHSHWCSACRMRALMHRWPAGWCP
jgi:hypothetical protein